MKTLQSVVSENPDGSVFLLLLGEINLIKAVEPRMNTDGHR
jgi:hypothetical protein